MMIKKSKSEYMRSLALYYKFCPDSWRVSRSRSPSSTNYERYHNSRWISRNSRTQNLRHAWSERYVGCNYDSRRIYWFVLQLRKASSGARADDASSLKSRGLDYVSHCIGPLNPPINAAAKKTHVRGFHHVNLTRLIIGVDYVESYDKDPEAYDGTGGGSCLTFSTRFCQQLLIGKLKLESGDFCVFLYDAQLYDPGCLSSGLCRGPLLVLVRISACSFI